MSKRRESLSEHSKIYVTGKRTKKGVCCSLGEGSLCRPLAQQEGKYIRTSLLWLSILLPVPSLAQVKPEGQGNVLDAVWDISLLGPEQWRGGRGKWRSPGRLLCFLKYARVILIWPFNKGMHYFINSIDIYFKAYTNICCLRALGVGEHNHSLMSYQTFIFNHIMVFIQNYFCYPVYNRQSIIKSVLI